MHSVLLVCWIEDNPIKFSIQTRSDISDGNLRGRPFESLIEKVIDMNWNRRQFKAKIINFGSRAMMKTQMAVEIEKARVNESLPLPAKTHKPLSIKDNQIAKKKAKIDLVIATPVIEKGDEENKDHVIQELKRQLEKEQSENQRLQSQLEYFKETLDKAESDTSDIGNNIFVKKAALHALKSVSGNANVFARNLFKHVFEIHEIVGRSLMGKKCNAWKHLEVNPAVNEAKRDAVIQYALTEFKMGPGSIAYKSARNDMKHSLSNLVVELNQDAKRTEETMIEIEDLN